MKKTNVSSKIVMVGASVLVAALLTLIVFILVGGYSPSAIAVNTGAAENNVKLWQEKEAPAYVPVRRDSEVWRSVSMPPAHLVEEMLAKGGKISLDAPAAEREQAVQEWYQQAQKDAYIGPDPQAFRDLMAREEALLSVEGDEAQLDVEDESLPVSPKYVLGVVVEFAPPGGSENVTRTFPVDPISPSLGCTTVVSTFTSLELGDDPPPGPRDNFHFFKPDISTADYESAFFDVGPDAGYGVVRPDLGGIDLSGFSLNNYLLEMSRGTYTTTGGVLTMPVSVPHSQEYYGHAVYSEDDEGDCVSPTFSDANYQEYAPDIIDAIIAQYGDNVDWSQFDADGDHIIDLLVTIHAGYGFQEGGGEDRLSTSSSGFFGTLPQIGGLSTPADDSDDYFVRGFNVDPEQLDVGAIQEEFEHQFGLPDIYVTDGANSNAFWGAHSSGVWGGPLGATRPVGHNLWQDWVLGWRDPMVIDYDDPQLLNGTLEVNIGRARYTPEGAEDGVIIRMPDEEVEVENLAGSGTGWWSDSGNLMDNRVYRTFDLITATAPVTFSFDAYWDIETDWDYGFVEVLTETGGSWTTLPDIDGVLTDTNPHGNNLGWGLTGSGDTQLRFDLSAYAGMTVSLRLRYLTDPAVSNPGWWVDNLVLEDASGTVYENDLETDFSDWMNEGWLVVPFTEFHERYYLVEWRDDNGFDESLNDPYYPVYSNPNEPPPEFEVERLPATTPGMLMVYRNTGEGFDYSIQDNLYDPPTVGPKFAMLVVDSHYEAKRFDTTFSDFQDGQAGYTMYGRTKSGHAAFGHEPTNEWTAKLGFNVDAGQYMTTPLETKTWPSESPVQEFHDSYAYYPGWYFSPDTGFVYLHDDDSSTILPAKGSYSTRVTDVDGNPLEFLYGIPVAGSELGTGHPGDDHVHYGLHVEVVESSETEATIRIWNDPYQVKASASTDANTMIAGITGTVTVDVSENIGGRLEDPLIVVELPDNVGYIDGSSFGGLVPVTGTTAAEVAAYVSSVGFDAVAERAATATTMHVQYLVWSGDDIGTAMSGPTFGFDYEVVAAGDLALTVSFYRNGTENFQTEELIVTSPGRLFLPVVMKQ